MSSHHILRLLTLIAIQIFPLHGTLVSYNNMEGALPKVTLEKFALLFEGRDPMVVDMSLPEEEIENTNFNVKEGAEFQVQLTFRVENAIVAGLRYHQVMYRKGISSDKFTLMVGSYGPKEESHVYTSPEKFELPKGMMYRGHYSVHSKFINDDKVVLKDFKWGVSVRRDWE